MEEAPSAVGSIQGRQVFGKEAQVIWEGEERQEPPQTWTSLPAGRPYFCSGPCGPAPDSTVPGGLSLAPQTVLLASCV